MQKRSVVAVIIFSLITCGIYNLYWFYVTTEALNREDPEQPVMNFILALLLGIVTCGIFQIYWYYTFYKKLDKVLGEDNCILNFILTIFLTSIVGSAIAQNSINNHE